MKFIKKPKNAPKDIYLVFGCDEWKSEESMKLISACTSLTKLKKAILRELSEGHIQYGFSENATKEDMMQELRDDFALRCRKDINDRLTGAFIDIVEDGAEYN